MAGFLLVYIIGCLLAGTVALGAKNIGLFSISSKIVSETSNIVSVDAANPMSILLAFVPET